MLFRTTSHMQTHNQSVSKQQPPWKMISHPLLLPPPSPSSPLLFFKLSMIFQGMEHLWSAPGSCCVPSQLLAHSLQEAAAGWGQKEKALTLGKCCSATAKPRAINPKQHQMGSHEERKVSFMFYIGILHTYIMFIWIIPLLVRKHRHVFDPAVLFQRVCLRRKREDGFIIGWQA